MTEVAKAPSTRDITMAQGAWYLAENCLQDLSGCTTTGKVHRWGRAWACIRQNLSRLVGVEDGGRVVMVDFEKGIARTEGESESSWQGRVVAFNLAHTAWKEQTLVMVLSPKHMEAVQQAVRHAVESKKLSFGAGACMSTNYAMQLVATVDPAAAESDE
jgi:hypothetical protein